MCWRMVGWRLESPRLNAQDASRLFVSSPAPQLGSCHLRFACASAYIPAISDLENWTTALRKTEQELAAATTHTAINAAAKRVVLANRT